MKRRIFVLAGLVALSGVAFFAHTLYANTYVSGPFLGYAWSDTVGWIDLNCANSGSCGTASFGLSIGSDGAISGHAWSENIGWVSAEASDLIGCPSAPCAASYSGGALSGWFKALSADGNGWDGWISLSGSSYGPVFQNDAFSGFAWGSDVVGWVDFSDAHLSCAPTYSCAGGTITYTDSRCATTAVQTCTLPAFCSAGSSVCLLPQPAFTAFTASDGALQSGHIQIRPALVRAGQSTKVYWSLADVASCTVTGENGDSWSGASSGTSGKTTSPIMRRTIFTLSCTGLDDSAIEETATVNVAPVFQEL